MNFFKAENIYRENQTVQHKNIRKIVKIGLEFARIPDTNLRHLVAMNHNTK